MNTADFFQATLESLPDAVVATDAMGHIRYLNVTAKRLLGASLNEARGRPFAELVALRDGETGTPVASPLARLLARDSVLYARPRDILVQPDGAEVEVEESAALIRGRAGEVIGMVFILRVARDGD